MAQRLTPLQLVFGEARVYWKPVAMFAVLVVGVACSAQSIPQSTRVDAASASALASTPHNVWATASPPPAPSYAGMLAANDTIAYLMGGVYGSRYESLVFSYSATTNQWRAEASMPAAAGVGSTGAIGFGGAAADNGIVYVAGGENAEHMGGMSIFEAYHPVTKTWEALTAMPRPRTRLAAAALNGVLYVGGGQTQTSVLGILEAYNVATKSWSELAPMPTPRSSFALVVANSLLYAIGGNSGTPASPVPSAVVEAYNPATNAWSTLAPMPTPRWGLAASADGTMIYAIGGLTTGTTSSLHTVEGYDVATNQWITRLSLPRGRADFSAVTIAGKVYVPNGIDRHSGNSDLYVYTP